MASPPPPSSCPSPPSKKLKMSSATASSDEDEYPDGAVETVAQASLPSAPPEPKRRFKRRKIAIILAYCGAGYQGMQKNPGARTIEGDLEEALFLAGGVPDHDRGKPRRYDWARAARTDKGVSAAGQVVSGRFYIDPAGFVDRLNANLSPQIRVFGYTRVTASFSAKKFCDRRRYVYLLPVFALDPNAHPDRESVMASIGSENVLTRCLECSERGRKVPGLVGRRESTEEDEKTRLVVDDGRGNGNEESITEVEGERKTGTSSVGVVERLEIDHRGDVNADAPCLGSETTVPSGPPEGGKNASSNDEGDKETKLQLPSDESDPGNDTQLEIRAAGESAQESSSKFEYGEKEKAKFNAILGRYVGTHNFHNFTTRTKAEDPSARRYIISFAADSVVDIGGIEFVRCEVVGQSFMLHQIRKMIGLAVAIMRSCTPESTMDTALRKDVSINVPTAPEVGLYLDECLFTSYNHKWKESHEAVAMEAYAEQTEEFKKKNIFSHIAAMEHKEGAVALWLHSLNHRNYPDFRLVEAADAGAAAGGVAEAEMA